MSFTLSSLVPADSPMVEEMLDHAFGLSRSTKTSYRLREGNHPVPGLSLAARDHEQKLLGAISFWPLSVGRSGTPALLLGPLVVHWQHQGQGIGLALMNQGLERAKHQGQQLVILVGDAPYYARAGFQVLPEGQLQLPGPFDPRRFLYLELIPGCLANYSGLALPPQRFVA